MKNNDIALSLSCQNFADASIENGGHSNFEMDDIYSPFSSGFSASLPSPIASPSIIETIPSVDNLLLPPINKTSLSSLSFQNVIQDWVQLHRMHVYQSFRVTPEIADGTDYWKALQEDIIRIQEGFKSGERVKCPVRLEFLLQELRGMIQLVNQQCLHELDKFYKVDHFVSELENGSFDFTSFIGLISCLLQMRVPSFGAARKGELGMMSELAKAGDFIACLKLTLETLKRIALDDLHEKLAEYRGHAKDATICMEKSFWAEEFAQFEKLDDLLPGCIEWLRGLRVRLNEADVACGLTPCQDVETLFLDDDFLRGMRRRVQATIIKALCISTMRWITGKILVSFDQLDALKSSIDQELSKPDASADGLNSSLNGAIETALQHPTTRRHQAFIRDMIAEMTDPSSPAYTSLARRLAKHLVDMQYSKEKTEVRGFDGIHKEVSRLGDDFLRMAQMNWAVHCQTYEVILNTYS